MGSSQVFITEEALTDEISLLHFELLSGPVQLDSLKLLTENLKTTPSLMPVLLVSHHSTLPNLEAPEEQEWLIAAGEYRQAQELFKSRGGQLFSMVTKCLVGGTYLVHGMAARHRFVYEDTTIYPSLPKENYEAIFQQSYPHSTQPEAALNKGVITNVTTLKAFRDEVIMLLSHS